jgi:hypothetical protein
MEGGRTWCLALYAHRHEVRARAIVELMSTLLQRFALKPGGTSLKWMHSEKLSHTRWSALSRQILSGTSDELEFLALERRRPDHPNGQAEYHQFDVTNDTRRSSVFSVSDRVTPNGIDDMLDLADLVLPIVAPRYGFVVPLDMTRSAIFYSVGIPYNEPSTEERERQIAWRGVMALRYTDKTRYQRALTRKMRDVYPLNLLTKNHLDQPVDGMSLQSWIEARSMGTLTRMKQGIWVWRLSPEQITSARSRLLGHGLLHA